MKPPHRALTGIAPDFGCWLQIVEMHRGGKIIIALHAGAVSGDHRDAHAIAAPPIAFEKPFARPEHDLPRAHRGTGTGAPAHPLDRQPGVLRFFCEPAKRILTDLAAVP